MRKKVKIKTIADRLTDRQRRAIALAKRGIYGEIQQVVIETHKAVIKTERVLDMGSVTWAIGSLNHYSMLERYLLTFVNDSVIAEQLTKELKRMDSDGN